MGLGGEIDITLRLASRACDLKPWVTAVHGLIDGRARIDGAAVRPHAFIPTLTGEVVSLANQRLALAPFLRRALGEDVRHGARLRKLFREGFPVTAGQRKVVGFAGHGEP